jgi:hypothetical protein
MIGTKAKTRYVIDFEQIKQYNSFKTNKDISPKPEKWLAKSCMQASFPTKASVECLWLTAEWEERYRIADLSPNLLIKEILLWQRIKFEVKTDKVET